MRGIHIHVVDTKRTAILLLFGGLLVLGLILWGALAPDPAAQQQTPAYPQQIAGIPVTTDLVPDTNSNRTHINREIRYVVIHETGNPSVGANAQAHANYIKQGAQSRMVSWHYTVDDHEIYHHLPDNEVGWHAGDQLEQNGGNLNGIGVEICINEDGDFEQALQNAAKLTAYLLQTYHLDLDCVKQHGDFSGKNCPATLRDTGRWEEFLLLVEQNLQGTSPAN